MNFKRSKLKRIFKKNKAIPDGIRQGQELDEVLGYQLERGLHENNETKKLTPSTSRKIQKRKRKIRKN